MICSVSQQTCAEHPLPCPEHVRRKLVNRQTGFRPPGAHRPNSGRGKLLMIYNDLFYLFTGLGMKGTWYKYLRWLGYSAGEWGRKEKSGLHGELFEMVLLCHLSIRCLDLAYGPRLILPPPTARRLWGQQLATCWGILALASAVHLRQSTRALLGGSCTLCLHQCAQTCNGYTLKPCFAYILPSLSTGLCTGDQLKGQMMKKSKVK